MPKYKFIFILIFISYFDASAQKMVLDKVSKMELQENKNRIDTSASAAIIFKKAKTIFKYNIEDGFVSHTEFQIKLKIYKKEGLEWANFKIPYYVGYTKLNDESIKILSAYTYNLENDKIVKNKVTNEGKFQEQINEYWKVKSLTFPNVKEGSIIELSYELKSENLSILPEFQFQYDIPVNFAEYVLESPQFYSYKGLISGFVKFDREETTENTSVSFEDVHRQTKYMSFIKVKTKYTVKDVPAIREEAYVNNINNYYGKVYHELQTIIMPEEKPKQIASTWEDVAKSIYDDKDFKTATQKFDYFTTDIKLLLNESTTQEEKAIKIFNFVKKRMNWDGKYGYYPKKNIEIAYSDKVGSIAEINLMMVSMLRMAGLDANPVLVSTRDNGIAFFPNRSLFNYVIAAVTIENKTILLDATSKYSDFNILPIRALNWTGRLIKSDGSSVEIDLMPTSISKDIVSIMANISEQGEVTGKIRDQYFDYNALVYREKYNGLSKESYTEAMEKRNLGLEITDYEVQNSNDLSKPIVENYSFTSTNSVEIIGDKMYMSPFLFFTLTENPFKQEKREYPVDFVYPNQDKFNISLTIPEGYTLEALPQSKVVTMPEEIANFKYNISNNGNQIQILYTLDVNQTIISSEYYEALKNFFKEIVDKQTEKIVLKKV